QGAVPGRKLGGDLFGDSDQESAAAFATESDCVSQAGRHHPSRAGEGSGTPLPARSGHAGGFAAPEAGFGPASCCSRGSRIAAMKKRLRWLAATVAVIVAAVVAGHLVSRPSAKLTDKDTIVLADFDNKTGDAVFDDTLKQGLSVQLGQSPF